MIKEKIVKDYLKQIKPVDHMAKRRIMLKEAKSLKISGSLGILDTIAKQVLSIKEEINPYNFRKSIVVMAGDHGVAKESISVFKSSVTGKLLQKIGEGKAPINAIANTVGAFLVPVDMGVTEIVKSCPTVLNMKLGYVTNNISKGPAMYREQVVEGILRGIQLVSSELLIHSDIIAVGEIGIGNTTSASAITSLLCRVSPEETVGQGTGIALDVQDRKINIVKKSLLINMANPDDPIDILTKLGGFEIVGVVGVILGAAINKIPVVVDGFISSVAGLLAYRMSQIVSEYMIISHLSAEPGHKYVVQELNKSPLLSLGMRLGQASGAGLTLPLIESACAVYLKSATIRESEITAEDKNI
ncbi:MULTISPECIES: nicotinate-nucleotide--dimethylbenzimidazole phosphoribosyltransferase [Photorhabdus]|uniref:Nicotinate-nucleotide--dimethylbenzimidazole phosphoribosyltransferase n=1 Tax=Photorhabdus kayaii TaxID=230088 RepID=A0ABX0B0Z6_9GAMM|nr:MULTISPECIES: nicotinate-nucleotide--dimethylbenzimidazole phosphoribosyltransferase [Photorhabdus]MCC8376618.1 nicotinate-nucleotide--dimethylbenzimidazole phosphoribosyltransferase [Photorhabdus bodei]MCT8351238.1 nicotinate-nucleotide--dimethylbenzimidazole phosphoribosyltransferase [Photorhabdus kayaii]MDB6367996.1 nicotinate-nucleotide--dimethylbenzimidazole phosphoribosyltransferase [Photorhabdus bodei]NDL13055.1 nicotinate-nucleotide--dimethylbenzimidazole phosphoribosyltransferase [P